MAQQPPTARLGAPMRSAFQFAPGWRNFNHGSFGSTPTAVTQTQRAFQDEAEAAPDVLMRYAYSDHLLAARRAAAQVLGAPLARVVLVPNATTGVNTVLRNLVFAPTDHIIVFSTIYAGCERAVQSVAETTGAQVTVIPLVFPQATHAQIVALLEQAVAQIRGKGETARIAIFDTVVATPAARMPFERLTEVCRDEGILSLVDAAHGAGLLAPLDVGALDPDFLVTNLHKWLFVPRACAAFYVAERSQGLMRTTLPTSWGFVPRGQDAAATYLAGPTGYAQSAFEALFETVGTLDMAAWFSVPAAVAWRQEACGGEGAILAHCVGVAQRGCQRVAEMLGTEVLENGEGELTRGLAMRNVRLPLAVADAGEARAVVQALSSRLIQQHQTYAPVAEHGGHYWIRLCAQVYLDDADFAWLGGVLEGACRDVRSGAWRRWGDA